MPNILVGERWQNNGGEFCYVEDLTDMGEVISVLYPGESPNSKPKRSLMCKRTFLLFFKRAPEDKPTKPTRTQWERLIED
jgi:hypothetical protein